MHTVVYAVNFHGGLIQWPMVVICIWCVLFVTSQYDVIFIFPKQRFGEISWHNMQILLHTLYLIYVSLNSDEKHLEEIENLYAELTSALLAAASSAIKTTSKKNEGKFNIPGWNSVVKSKHQIAKAIFRLWVNCNRPKIDDIYRNMTKTK